MKRILSILLLSICLLAVASTNPVPHPLQADAITGTSKTFTRAGKAHDNEKQPYGIIVGKAAEDNEPKVETKPPGETKAPDDDDADTEAPEDSETKAPHAFGRGDAGLGGGKSAMPKFFLSSKEIKREKPPVAKKRSTGLYALHTDGVGAGAVIHRGENGGASTTPKKTTRGVHNNGSSRNLNIVIGQTDPDGNHFKKKRRGLKEQSGGGIGKLKARAQDHASDPIACNARKGKLCKRGDDVVARQAKEFKGDRLTKEGHVEKLVHPDFTLSDNYDGAAFASNPALAYYRQENLYEKQFFSLPMATTSTSSQTVAEAAHQQLLAQGSVPMPESRAGGESIPEVVMRSIPIRPEKAQKYRVGEKKLKQGAGSGAVETAPQEEPLGVANYRARSSFYAQEGTQEEKEQAYLEAANAQAASETAAAAQAAGETYDTAATGNLQGASEVATGEAQDVGYQHPVTSYDQYAAWFNAVDESIGASAAPVDSTVSTSSVTGANQNTETVEYIEEGGTYYDANSVSNFFDEYEDDDEDTDDEVVNDDDGTGDDGTDDEAVEVDDMDSEIQEVGESAANTGQYLSVFESSTGAPTVAESQSPNLGNAEGLHSNSTHAPGVFQSQNNTELAIVTDSATGAPVGESLSLGVERDESGLTFFTEMIAANPVYVETMGTTDLSTKKIEFFDSITPLFSRHLESQVGNDLIEDYELTITYVQSEDSIVELRQGSDSKTFVTELIFMVVFHLRNIDKARVTSMTTELATEHVESFFDPANPDLRTLIRMLNAMGVYTKDIYARDQPKATRNHAMEHGISKITPSNTDVQEDKSNKGFWSFFHGDNTNLAIIAASVAGAIVMAVLGLLWYKQEHREALKRRSRIILEAASDISSEIGSRAQVSLQNVRDKVHRSRRMGRGRGYFSMGFLRGRSTDASINTQSDASSTLSYIQPAAIQLRRNRNATVKLPETPLEGRQDDDHDIENPKTTSRIYDINIDDDTDLRGTPRVVPKHERLSMPDKHDYNSDSDSSASASTSTGSNGSSSSGSEKSTDGENTRASQLSRLSLDRISIARSAKAEDERSPVKASSPLQETFKEKDELASSSDRRKLGNKSSSDRRAKYSRILSNQDDDADPPRRAHSIISRLTSGRDDAAYSYETVQGSQQYSSLRGTRAAKGVRSHEDNQKSHLATFQMSDSRRPASPQENPITQQSFVPLSPLSSALAEALADSPKPLTYTASRPRTPVPVSLPQPRRRAPDPPESLSFATSQYSYGSKITPPTSMQDIMPEEYINRKRWQDDEDDSTVDLPDHLSSAAASSAAASQYSPKGDPTPVSKVGQSYVSDMSANTDRALVLYDRDGKREKSKKYYQY